MTLPTATIEGHTIREWVVTLAPLALATVPHSEVAEDLNLALENNVEVQK